MNGLLSSYLPIVIFLAVALGVCAALIIAPFVVAYRNPDPEKLSAYECGFNAFDDARMKFDVRFYLVAILFIIFDLEVAFLFPWAVSFAAIGWLGFWSMMVFLGVLTIGFIYEWKKGALEWD
ncbi:NADH-quinone oxidoreductase subunit A [Chelativorans salis]|uniref:NADH-quinone oxidoreductase subunit A n=1 Tax=Chelativorans salis TaxID=2978478 RepID=A0ABT2LML3_9HYPH|nr:NADH-quinone oxidoreductase subunit A [Chelativorans sp. EGI FJ00035]MCT7375806.1 NADH-quinone oxidoreductase subunit A [Chelativorans sp. EGI FJ00035]